MKIGREKRLLLELIEWLSEHTDNSNELLMRLHLPIEKKQAFIGNLVYTCILVKRLCPEPLNHVQERLVLVLCANSLLR